MKNAKNVSRAVIFFSMVLCSFAFMFDESSQIKISISGVEHDFMKEGVKTTEFGELSVESKVKTIRIESFQITLARGNRAVDISEVSGNTFNLRKYSHIARAGDRIVIEVKSVAGEGASVSSSPSILALKVI